MRILNPKGSNKVLKTPESEANIAEESGASAFSVQTIDELDLFDDSSSGNAKTKGWEPSAGKEPSANKEPLADRKPSADKQPSANKKKKQYERVFAKAIYLLSMREHSVKEIQDKLSKKCDLPDLISAVVDDLLENNYLSNSRFTETYVRSRRAKGFGPTKIRMELTAKGIDSGMATDYLEAESAIWYETAEHQYHKKYGDKVISDYNTWTKRARFLQSRGFTMDHIHSTLKRPESE